MDKGTYIVVFMLLTWLTVISITGDFIGEKLFEDSTWNHDVVWIQLIGVPVFAFFEFTALGQLIDYTRIHTSHRLGCIFLYLTATISLAWLIYIGLPPPPLSSREKFLRELHTKVLDEQKNIVARRKLREDKRVYPKIAGHRTVQALNQNVKTPTPSEKTKTLRQTISSPKTDTTHSVYRTPKLKMKLTTRPQTAMQTRSQTRKAMEKL